jgi:hypothetical protein
VHLEVTDQERDKLTTFGNIGGTTTHQIHNQEASLKSEVVKGRDQLIPTNAGL